MKEFVQKIVNNLNIQIIEFEKLDGENRQFLKKAETNKNVLQIEVEARMKLAKKQLDDLKILKAWKEYYETTYLDM